MAYGTANVDNIQSSTSGTPVVFKDGSGTQIGTLCRAWVSFVGATGVINASFNVSSVTRSSTGQYAVNFTTAMPDTKYCANVSMYRGGSSFGQLEVSAVATGSVSIETINPTATVFVDPSYGFVSVFR